MLVLVVAGAQGALADADIPAFGGCYFAPMTSIGFYRMRDEAGRIREFSRSARPGILEGVNGWWARLKGDNDVVVVRPAADGGERIEYDFRGGVLASVKNGGRICRLNYPQPVVYEDESIAPLWPEVNAEEALSEMDGRKLWDGGDRFRLWFQSPNQCGAFLSFVFIVLLAAGMRVPRRAAKAALLVLSAVAFAAVVATASRSALIGAASGALSVVVASLWRRVRLSAKVLSLAAAAALLVFAAAFGAMYLKGRSAAADSQSNATRCELYRAAPRMMRDAPGGFRSRTGVGQAYTYWYQDVGTYMMRLNLVSDQLTELVKLGWPMRVAWLFAWAAVLFALAVAAFGGGLVSPLGVWIALLVSSSLNNVLFNPQVYALPLVLLAAALFVSWREVFSTRRAGAAALFAAVCALLASLALYTAGWLIKPDGPVVAFRGDAVLVNGSSPTVWVVDDGKSLGLVATSRDIRRFYARLPKAPAIGYVKGMDALPAQGVSTLVLAGERGEEFIDRFQKGDLPFATPKRVVFVAPTFGPSEVPGELRDASSVTYAIGEFAARYFEDLEKPPSWCTVMRGAEVYIPGWMQFCFAGGITRGVRK